MDICIIGSGYVGLVTGACFAARGHEVTCADIDEAKITSLGKGITPFYEPGLDELVREGIQAGRLRFTGDVAGAVRSSTLVMISVGTPPHDDGSADTSALFAVADLLGEVIDTPKTVVIRSTAPVGTAQAVADIINAKARARVAMLANPEFLREGNCIEDFLNPARVVIGADHEGDEVPLRELYGEFVPEDRVLVLDSRSAEMTKYAANSFLAMKISFINEIANLCEAVGADVELVRQAMAQDPRIGGGHLSPGLGYGGSCFPKDVQALLHTGRQLDVPMGILNMVHQVNELRPTHLARKIHDRFGGSLAGRRLALWGLTFKPGTSDMRSAPSLAIIDRLLAAGATVVAFDPTASLEARRVIGERIEYAPDEYEGLRDVDALVLVTEWEQFHEPDWERMRQEMASPIIFDGRNLYDPAAVMAKGFEYVGVGRRQGAAPAHVGRTLETSL